MILNRTLAVTCLLSLIVIGIEALTLWLGWLAQITASPHDGHARC